MATITVLRHADIIDNLSPIEPVFRIREFPINMGCTVLDDDLDVKIDQVWSRGKSSGVIQLEMLAPLEILYAEQHDAGVIGALWLEHHHAFSSFIRPSYQSGPILEIGGAHGILSRETNVDNSYDWTIIEPAPKPADGVTATYIQGFFGDIDQDLTNIDCLVHSHVFEHIYNPRDFLRQCAESLSFDGVMFFAVPNIFEMVKRGYSNSINFEHTVFYCEEIIEHLLALEGFEVVGKEYFKEDHSIFYRCKLFNTKQPVSRLELPDDYEEVFNKFWSSFEDDARELQKALKNDIGTTFLFGAHIFSQILINLGLDEGLCAGILDNASSKSGKRLYGSNLEVSAPDIIRNIKKPQVILRAGAYNNEIKAQLEGLNSEVIIL